MTHPPSSSTSPAADIDLALVKQSLKDEVHANPQLAFRPRRRRPHTLDTFLEVAQESHERLKNPGALTRFPFKSIRLLYRMGRGLHRRCFRHQHALDAALIGTMLEIGARLDDIERRLEGIEEHLGAGNSACSNEPRSVAASKPC